jgi:hypothetical protein
VATNDFYRRMTTFGLAAIATVNQWFPAGHGVGSVGDRDDS